jgi:hypothetical protein
MICDDRVVNLKMQGRPNGILKPPANIHNQMLGPPKQKPPEKNHEPRTTDHVAWRPAYEGEEPPF